MKQNEGVQPKDLWSDWILFKKNEYTNPSL